MTSIQRGLFFSVGLVSSFVALMQNNLENYIIALFCISPEMSRKKDGLNLYACRRRWQAFGDEDKTLSLWALLPRPLLRVGSWDVDTVGLVWWNWFDKRETVTSVNKTQFRIHTLEKKHSSLWTPSPRCFLPFPPHDHMQRPNKGINSPAFSYKSQFLTEAEFRDSRKT